jgi:hypothetical protein
MPTDPTGAALLREATERKAMADALRLDAANLEALGQCGCFRVYYEDGDLMTDHVCALHESASPLDTPEGTR